MDKIAVISDIHGNLPALEAVLDDIAARGIELIYNLGDLVGKGARSDLVVDRCREVCQVVLRGNWDDAVCGIDDDDGRWYRAQLGEARLAYLDSLPNVYDFWLSGKRVRLFHASQVSVYTRVHSTDTDEIHKAMFENTAFTGMDVPPPDIVGYGDIHVAYMRSLFTVGKILFNTGSVGNPLDLPLASYAILSGDLDSQASAQFSLDFVRLPYDIEREIAEARRLNVPHVEAYAVELRTAVYRGAQRAAGQ